MRSPEQLRAEVRRLHLKMQNTADPEQRRVLAGCALELAQEAEAIADLPLDDVESLQLSIAHYKRMLADAAHPIKQRVLMHVLQRAEGKLEQASSRHRPRPHRVAAA